MKIKKKCKTRSILNTFKVFFLVCLLISSNIPEIRATASEKQFQQEEISPIDKTGAKVDESQKKEEFRQKADKIHIPFIENQGQLNGQVKYYADIFSGRFFVTDDGLTYTVIKADSEKGKDPRSLPENLGKTENKIGQTLAFREQFIDQSGNQLSYQVQGEEASAAEVSILKGNDQSKWQRNLNSFNTVNLGDIWDKINVRLRAYGKNVEKIFTVDPGGDPQDIKLQFDGIQNLKIDKNGELILHTELGDLSLTKPIAYQIDRSGNRIDISVDYSLDGENKYGFLVGEYDHSLPLVIDPLLASISIGGTQDEVPYALGIDSSNNVFVTGRTASSDFPTTDGVYDVGFNDSPPPAWDDADVFISKFDSNLHDLLASTYLGGDGSDYATTITFDSSDNVIVGGNTASSNFPILNPQGPDIIQDTPNAFVARLSNNLHSLQASTALTGDYGSQCIGVKVDPQGNIMMVGETWSDDIPIAGSSYQSTIAGGMDPYVAKLNPLHLAVTASTFVGGSNDEGVTGMNMDADGNVFVVGFTSSGPNAVVFPTTPNAYHPHFTNYTDGNNYFEQFIFKLNNALDTLVQSTLLGADSASLKSIAVNSSGKVYVTGWVADQNFSATSNGYDIYNQSYFDSIDGSSTTQQAIVLKFDNNLTTLDAATFLGGQLGQGDSIAVDSNGKVFVAGYPSPEGFPLTDGAYDTQNDSGDTFISKFDANLSDLEASTFFGYGEILNFDSSDNLYIAGQIDRSSENRAYDFIVSKMTNNLSADSGGGPSVSPANSVISASPAPGTVGTQETITITSKDTNGDPYTSGGQAVVITVSGSNTANPSVTDNGNGTYTAHYTPTNSGTDLITATMNSTAVGRDADGNSDGTFHLTVEASNPNPNPSATIDPAKTVISASPENPEVNDLVTITVTANDSNGNPITTGGASVILTVTGSNTANPTVTDNGDGTYTAHYTPDNSGIDLISGTINNSAIGSDTDGTSDGVYNLNISKAGAGTSSQTCNGKSSIEISRSRAGTKKILFEACVLKGDEASSEDIKRSSQKAGTIKKIYLKAKSKKAIEGKLTISRLKAKPANLSVPSDYTNSSHIILNYFRIKHTFQSDDISQAKLYVRIPKKWLSDNKIDKLVFLSSKSKNAAVLESKKSGENTQNVTYAVTFEKFDAWMTIIGTTESASPGNRADRSNNTDTSQNTAPPGQSGSSVLPSGVIQSDVDHDGKQEEATDADRNPSNGNEAFSDPDGSSQAIISTDGNGDGLTDQFIDTNKDGQPDTYWDPADNIISVIIPENSEGGSTGNFEFDSNGDGMPDKVIVSGTKEVRKKKEDTSSSKVDMNAVSNKKKMNQIAFLNTTKEYIAQHPIQANSAITAGLALPFIPIFFELNSLGDLWLVFKEAIFRLFGFLLSKKKKRGWGKVYDKNTGAPIPLATVNIYDEEGVRRESKITDSLGIYFFLVSPGKFVLEAIKNGYQALISKKDAEVKTFYEDDYQGGVLDVADPDLVNLDIPMTLQKTNLLHIFLNKKALQIILWVIFWAGLALNLIILAFFPSIVNLLITAAYVLLAIMRNICFKTIRWGMIVGLDGKPAPFAEVKILDPLGGNVIARTLTDLYGRYLIILREGKYILEAKNRDGSAIYSSNISVGKFRAVAEKIILENK